MPLCRKDSSLKHFQQQLQSFLEDLAVGIGIEQWCGKSLDLAGVIAAPDAHDHAAIGDDIGHRVVFGEPDRVPHRQDVETATEFQALCLCREPQPELNQVGQAFVTLMLEMVLGGPQRVIALLVHDPRYIERRGENLGQALA